MSRESNVLAAIVFFALAGCGGKGTSNGGTDGSARYDGAMPGESGGQAIDGGVNNPTVDGGVNNPTVDGDVDDPTIDGRAPTLDSPTFDATGVDAAAQGSGCARNPAEVSCLTSSSQCVPSSCTCRQSGIWVCTTDCRTNMPICTDAGASKSDATTLGPACGSVFCDPRNYCCNANCGMCAPLGASCVQVACEPPPTWVCGSDGDCQVKADTCTSCACSALGSAGTLATCAGPGVLCVVDPCGSKVARCIAGQCTVAGRNN